MQQRGEPCRTLDFHTGESIQVPILTPAVVDQILAHDRFSLKDVPLQSIVAFLNNVGKSWKNSESTRRRLYIRTLVKHLGYSEKMAEHEANWIALLLCSHYRILDALDVELGTRRLVDTWVPIEEAEVRALPRGRSLHILSGNVPLASVTSLVRALVTKNVCVVKASSQDPITPIFLALSFIEADSTHPVARALSVVHWAGGANSPEVHRLVQTSDVICAWGGAESMNWVTRAAPPRTEVLKFGPRRGLAIVGAGADVVDAARGLAHDVCVYDQRACFSTQQAFVHSSLLAPLVSELEHALELYRTLLPKGRHDMDACAASSLAELEALYAGADVRAGSDQSWRIIVGPPSVDAHPLGRTLYVQPFDSVERVLGDIDASVQTVAVTPWSLCRELRDPLATAGVARIVDLGLANLFRIGGTHDGMYPMQRLVRYASNEAPGSVHIKGLTLRVDQTRFLEEGRFEEFVP